MLKFRPTAAKKIYQKIKKKPPRAGAISNEPPLLLQKTYPKK